MTNYKDEAEKIFSNIDRLASGKLFHKEDLLRLIEMTLKNNNLGLLEDLSFQAKFSHGLMQIIKSSDSKVDEEYFSKIKIELTESILKIRSVFEKLIENADDFIKSIFVEKYLAMTQQSMVNLNNFCSDLGFLKLYLNDLKRKGNPQ